MKKLLRFCLMLTGICMMGLTSCAVEEDPLDDDTTVADFRKNIVGYWQETGTQEFYHFQSNGQGAKTSPSTGKYWDEADDVYEADVDPFQWYIETDGLYLCHSVNGQYVAPEFPIKVLSITSSAMKWKDTDGLTKSFSKVTK